MPDTTRRAAGRPRPAGLRRAGRGYSGHISLLTSVALLGLWFR